MSKEINKIYNQNLKYKMKNNTLKAEIRELKRKNLELKAEIRQLERKNLELKETNKELYKEHHEVTEKYLAKVEKCNQLEMDNFTIAKTLYNQRRTLNSYGTLKEKMDQEGIISMDSAAELIKNLEDENVDLLEIIKTKF